MVDMKCHRCGHNVENVGENVTSVTCWKCVGKPDIIKNKKKEVQKMTKKEKIVDVNIQKIQDYMKTELNLDMKAQKKLLSKTYHIVLNLNKQ